MDQAQNLRELVQAVGDGSIAPPRARVLAVTSGKGGVGKTNMSVSLALAAAREGRDVIVLDGDLGLANVDVIFDVQANYNLTHVIAGEVDIEDALIDAPGGVRLLAGAAGITGVADLGEAEHRQLLCGLERLEERADLIIVDTGAGISRRVIDFCVASGEVVVVTTPEPTAIADAYAMIKVLAQADPTLCVWLLVNMAANRGEAEQIMERIVVLSERFLGISVQRAGWVLADPRVPHAVRRRVPFLLAYPGAQASLCVEEIVRRMALDAPEGGARGGFFRRMTAILKERLGMPTGERQ